MRCWMVDIEISIPDFKCIQIYSILDLDLNQAEIRRDQGAQQNLFFFFFFPMHINLVVHIKLQNLCIC